MRVKSVLLIALMLWAYAAQADAFSDFGVIKPGVRVEAPDFSLIDMDGRQRTMASYQGKVVVLHFWATFCVPCRKELPTLLHLQKSFVGKNLELVYVNVDKGNKDKIEGFMNDIDLHFNTLLDPDGDVRKTYEVRALPTTYLIASDGKISGRIIGERDWKKAEPVLDALLADSEDSLSPQKVSDRAETK